jgi:putative flavoprotein involved in K+ transport
MRTAPSIFPRDWLGIPLGPSVLISEHLPSPPVDLLGRFIQWHVYGDLSAYGIPRAPQGFMTRFRAAGVNPAVDDGFVAALKSRRARVVAEIERLDRDGAILTSGEHLPADCVICATGYRRGLEPLVGDLGVLDERGAPGYGTRCHPTRRRRGFTSPAFASRSAARYALRPSMLAGSPGSRRRGDAGAHRIATAGR